MSGDRVAASWTVRQLRHRETSDDEWTYGGSGLPGAEVKASQASRLLLLLLHSTQQAAVSRAGTVASRVERTHLRRELAHSVLPTVGRMRTCSATGWEAVIPPCSRVRVRMCALRVVALQRLRDMVTATTEHRM